jgi:SAM-dependent methyltransferase
MHSAVYELFDDICRAHDILGTVLEIGATPDDSTLLTLPSLHRAAEKIGINKSGESRFKEFVIRAVDANDMGCFPSQSFDAVLCNSVLEHDPFFWKTLAEIRRVTRIGGLVVIGTPGYTRLPAPSKLRRLLSTVLDFSPHSEHSTPTLGIHNFPGDYYRFSEQAFREVFFANMKDVAIHTLLVPPRIVGTGIRT